MRLVALLVVFGLVGCFGNSEENEVSENSGPGKALFLTPLIEAGRLSEARKKAAVTPFVKGVDSYAGYLTVDKRYNSNLFFWFFQADSPHWKDAPVAVWLQGGPGGSSLLALFVENGPYILNGTTLSKRAYSWHKLCNMIYIDNPVGSGFSFTEYDEGYARNQTVIGAQLYSAIKQFFTLFPNLRQNEFFISGESYAGKYIPAFAHAIHKGNALDDKKVNLKGLIIGNGLVDPVNMLKYGDYLYQLGLIDTKILRKFHDYEKQIRSAIHGKRWNEATELFGKLVLQYIYYPEGSLYQNATGFHEHYNFVNLNPPDWTRNYTQFVTGDLLRSRVHVGNKPFADGKKTALFLKEDILKSVINLVEELVQHYRIVFYNGQLDIICAYPLTINFIKRMKWPSAHEYANADRHIWRINDQIAGYYKKAGNLTEVLVRDAGHMVPADQPLWAYELFSRFVWNKI